MIGVERLSRCATTNAADVASTRTPKTTRTRTLLGTRGKVPSAPGPGLARGAGAPGLVSADDHRHRGVARQPLRLWVDLLHLRYAQLLPHELGRLDIAVGVLHHRLGLLPLGERVVGVAAPEARLLHLVGHGGRQARDGGAVEHRHRDRALVDRRGLVAVLGALRAAAAPAAARAR